MPTMTLQELSDKQAIFELMVRYAERIDAGDAAGAAECFAPEGVGIYWGECVGRQAITDRLTEILARFSATSHHVTNPQITLAGERAAALSYVYAFHRINPEQQAMHVWGRWIDELTRIDDEWLFARREVVLVGSIGTPEGNTGHRGGDLDHPGHPGRMI